MKKLLLVSIAVFMLLANTAFAEVKTYTATGSYIMSPKETLETGIKHAREDAMRRISESVGTYIESQSEMRDQILTQDEIKTISASVIHVTNETSPSFVQYGKGLNIKITITAEADDSELFAKQIIENKQNASKLEDTKIKLEKAKADNENSAIYLNGAILKMFENGTSLEDVERYVNEIVSEEDSLIAKAYAYEALAECYEKENKKEKARYFMNKAADFSIEYEDYDTASSMIVNLHNIGGWDLQGLEDLKEKAYKCKQSYEKVRNTYKTKFTFDPGKVLDATIFLIDDDIKHLKKY